MSRRGTIAVAVLTMLALLPACGERPSPAADAYIERAVDTEERDALTLARDDIDEEQPAVVAEKDAEIARLREENEGLRERLAERTKR